MDDNVVVLDMETTLDIPADRVLEGAIGKLATVLVVGYKEDGELYIASSTAKRAEIHYLAALVQKEVMEE